MSHVVTGAYEAVKLANRVTGKSDPESQIGNLNGRRVRHWSYYLLLGASMIGGAAAIAAAIVGITPIIISGAIVFVTNGIGAYYVRKFDTFKELEDYVEVMSEKINEMSQYITRLQKVNRDLRQTADDLDENLDETIEVWEHGYDNIKSEADEIKRLTARLEVTTKKLKVMEEMYCKLQDGLNSFSNEVINLTQNRKDIDDRVAEWANQVKGSQVVLESLNSKNEDFDEQNAIYDELNKANLAFLIELQTELKQFLQLHADAKDLTQTLEHQGDVLTRVSEQIAESLREIGELENEEKQVKEDGRKLLRKTEKLTKALTKLVENISTIEKQ